MDRLTSLRVFREVVESGSFAAAAKRLGISPPMASKHLAQLERSVNTRLLHRTSRSLSLTDSGSTYYEQCRQALDMLDAAEASVGQACEGVRGQLKVSAPVWCANVKFARALAAYRRRYPEVVLDMHLENAPVDLVSGGYDVALRAAHELSPTLISRPLCQLRFHLVATPAFAKRSARAAESADLPVFDTVVPSYLDVAAFILPAAAGKQRFKLNVVMKSDNTTLTHLVVRAGMGAAFLPEWLVAEDLAARRLVRLQHCDEPPMPHTLFAVYTSRKYMAPKLRTFIDFMCAWGAAGCGPD